MPRSQYQNRAMQHITMPKTPSEAAATTPTNAASRSAAENNMWGEGIQVSVKCPTNITMSHSLW